VVAPLALVVVALEVVAANKIILRREGANPGINLR
jgi:hypothetical protein